MYFLYKLPLPIEEGGERQVMSYLRQWTQLIKLHMRGLRQYNHIPVLKCGCTGKTIATRAV